jgi:hypothetical protein
MRMVLAIMVMVGALMSASADEVKIGFLGMTKHAAKYAYLDLNEENELKSIEYRHDINGTRFGVNAGYIDFLNSYGDKTNFKMVGVSYDLVKYKYFELVAKGYIAHQEGYRQENVINMRECNKDQHSNCRGWFPFAAMQVNIGKYGFVDVTGIPNELGTVMAGIRVPF